MIFFLPQYMDMPMDRCARLEKMHPEHIYKHPYTNNEIHDQNDVSRGHDHGPAYIFKGPYPG